MGDLAIIGAALRAYDGVRLVFGFAPLRRIELALTGSLLGEWSTAITAIVVANDGAGLAGAGAVIAVRMLPAAVFGPVAAALADRYPRRSVMLAADAVRGVALLAAAGAALTSAPPLLVLAPVIAVPLLSTVFRPAQIALMPLLARSEQELLAANAVASTIFSVVTISGPLVSAGAMLLGGAPLALAMSGLLFAWSASQLMRLPHDRRPERTDRSVMANLSAGLSTIACHPPTRTIACAIGLQGLVIGATSVLTLEVAARSAVPDVAPNLLFSALGIGGLAGGLAAIALSARHLEHIYALALAAWATVVGAFGAAPGIEFALLAMMLLGGTNTVAAIAEETLLQRLVPQEVHGRTFGAIESLWMGTAAIGGLLTPVLIRLLGTPTTAVILGATLGCAALLVSRGLARSAESKELPPPIDDLHGQTAAWA